MDWATAEANFFAGPGREMTWTERTRWDYKEWGQQMSIAGLWSYRGHLWKKYAGAYPTPDEVGMSADDSFFDPDYVDHSRTFNRDGELLDETWFHRGRKLKPTHRLWATRPRGNA